jgi:predicted secreted protein
MKTVAPLVALLGFIGVSCSDIGGPLEPVTLHYDASVNAKTIAAFVGQRFTVTLDSWGDAGYFWESQVGDPLIVSQFGQASYKSANPGTVGGLWIATLTFSVNHVGQTIVTLRERQPWMKDVPPRASITFTVYALQ